jgi:hypothetical protein
MPARAVFPRRCLRLFAVVSLTLGMIAAPAAGQTPAAKSSRTASLSVGLGTVIAAFLADSGVRTRGLPWTTGDALGVKWESTRPVRNSDQSSLAAGRSLARKATFTAPVAKEHVPVELTVEGNEIGLARVLFSMPMQAVTREQVEKALRQDGLTLQPLKCSREKEGASYGNLLDAAKAPGKTASGLWWNWNCAHDGCTLGLTLLYRKADAAQIECYSG